MLKLIKWPLFDLGQKKKKKTPQGSGVVKKTNPRASNSSEPKPELVINFENGVFSATIPIKTVSEANNFDPWPVKHKRHQQQKNAVYYALTPHKRIFSLPCTVTMIRYGKRELDAEDNLRMAFKYIKDEIASILTGDLVVGRADSDKRITWQYEQKSAKFNHIKIIIESCANKTTKTTLTF